MKDVLQSFLRRVVLVFFDEIFVLVRALATRPRCPRGLARQRPPRETVQVLFGERSITYLDHVILVDDIAMNGDKVEAVASWPKPRLTPGIRGFLGLAGYYQKFIQDFGAITATLTRLLRKEAFPWMAEAETSRPSSRRSPPGRSSRCWTSSGGSLLTSRPRVSILAPSSTRDTAPWPSSVACLLPTTASWHHTSAALPRPH